MDLISGRSGESNSEEEEVKRKGLLERIQKAPDGTGVSFCAGQE